MKMQELMMQHKPRMEVVPGRIELLKSELENLQGSMLLTAGTKKMMKRIWSYSRMLVEVSVGRGLGCYIRATL